MKNVIILVLFFVFICANISWSQHKLKSSGQIPVLAKIGVPQEETVIARYEELRESGIIHNFSTFSNADAMGKALKIAQKRRHWSCGCCIGKRQ